MTVNRIGNVIYSDARGVKIREPENLDSIHSAISSTVTVEVETQLEANAIIAAWPVIIQAMADKVAEVKAAMPKPEPTDNKESTG